MLTGLLDRTSGISQLENRLMNAAEKSMHALFVIDIDHLKEINNKLGHVMGDTALKDIADALTASFREADIVSRFGGDDFVVLMTDIDNKGLAVKKAEDLCAVFRKNYGDEAISQNISASIGISIFPDHGTHHEELLNFAEKAMCAAKARGGNGCTLYMAENCGGAYEEE